MADVYFVDTSALSKRYIVETGSPWLQGILDPTTGCQAILVRTTMVEMIAAITRRERGRSLTPGDAEVARAEFRTDLKDEYTVMEMSEALANRAMLLAQVHGLRGYDAIQLSAAMEANVLRLMRGESPIILLSSDAELNAAATAEGLTVDNPNSHPERCSPPLLPQ